MNDIRANCSITFQDSCAQYHMSRFPRAANNSIHLLGFPFGRIRICPIQRNGYKCGARICGNKRSILFILNGTVAE